MSTSFRPREAFEPIGEQPKMSGFQEGAFYEKKFIHRRAILSAGLLTERLFPSLCGRRISQRSSGSARRKVSLGFDGHCLTTRTYQRDKVADRAMRFNGMPQRAFSEDMILVLSANLFTLDETVLLKVSNYPLYRSLCNSNFNSNFPKD